MRASSLSLSPAFFRRRRRAACVFLLPSDPIKKAGERRALIKAGSSILGSCVVFENWTSPSMSGKSFNIFDAKSGSWRQSWVSDKGTLLEFTGELKNGTMVYLAPDKEQGKSVLRRMIFTPIDAQTVRQVGEDSFDAGKTWAPSYDLLYHRK